MTLTIRQVDAFTDRPFAGNPAGVCVIDSGQAAPPAEWMQRIAMEMNLAETAFVTRRDNAAGAARGAGGWNLRWFTPAVEVDLCGHATLASAHVLWETGALDADEAARFDTRSGRLTATRRGAQIEMDFPADPPALVECPPGVAAALGLKQIIASAKARQYRLLHVKSEAELRGLAPDFAALRRATADCVIVTAASVSSEFDFVSRFFAPGFGIDEDPATGSAHCVLGPYWTARLGRNDLVGYQASKRGGLVRVRLPNGPAGTRVLLGGQAVTVMRAALCEAALPWETVGTADVEDPPWRERR